MILPGARSTANQRGGPVPPLFLSVQERDYLERQVRRHRAPRFHVHFTPTSASWINQVERWFAELTRTPLQRGAHTSVTDLEADIMSFIESHNENPKPFKWTKSADQIRASVKRFCHRLDQTLCSEL